MTTGTFAGIPASHSQTWWICTRRAGKLYKARSRRRRRRLYRSQILQVNSTKYLLGSSRRDLHNALRSTAILSQNFCQRFADRSLNCIECQPKFAKMFFSIFTKFWRNLTEMYRNVNKKEKYLCTRRICALSASNCAQPAAAFLRDLYAVLGRARPDGGRGRRGGGPVGWLPSVGKCSANFSSFSAVSAPIFAGKYAFCSIFKILQLIYQIF